MGIFGKAVHLAGSTAPARHYLEEFVDLTQRGELDVSPLIDRSFAFADIKEACEAMNTGAALKVVLKVA
jgi:Zn-dependent alcohol dehydrogenase